MQDFGPFVNQVLEFAAIAHDTLTRKLPAGTKTVLGQPPTLAHLAGTGTYLLIAGCDRTTWAVGILHDILEDTAVTQEDLAREFDDTDPEIAEDVWALTYQPEDGDFATQREQYYPRINTLRRRQVALADILYNGRSFLLALERAPDGFVRCGTSPKQEITHWCRVIEIGRRAEADECARRLITGCEEMVRQIKDIVGTAASGL